MRFNIIYEYSSWQQILKCGAIDILPRGKSGKCEAPTGF